MDKIETQIIPVPPNLLTALRTGFDSIANQVAVIIIPVLFDILLWLGPHIQIKTLINNFLAAMASTPELGNSQSADLLKSSIDIMKLAADRINIFSMLRTIPVGVPSIMSGRLPIEVPFGKPLLLDVLNPLTAILITLALILIGLVIGSLYYLMIVQVALSGKVNFIELMKTWPKATMQVLSLTAALFILFIAISIPSSCAIFAITLFGLPLGQFAFFLYMGILLWLAFPLLFSAHGIFVNHNNALTSVQRSMMLTKLTLPTTSFFVITILAISEGLDLLWRVPPESSWLTLVGLGGHAFVTTALLAASFVYYRDADRWIQEVLTLGKAQKGLPV